MPLVFTKPQIRRYLAEMGYEDVDDDHLNDFIKDLKKLIKHDERKRKARSQGEESQASGTRTSGHDQHMQTSITGSGRGRHADYLDRTHDTTGTGGASSDSDGSFHSLNATADDLVQVQGHTSAQQLGGKPRTTSGADAADSHSYHSHRHDHHGSRSGNVYNGTSGRNRDYDNDRLEPRESGMTRASKGMGERNGRQAMNSDADADVHPLYRFRKSRNENEYKGTDADHRTASSSGSRSSSLPSTISSMSIDTSSSSQESEERKPKFNIPDSVKTDPVALYHYYNSYWSKHKIPGVDSHRQLRWNVRAGTMGRVPCTPCGERVNYLRR